MSDCKDERQSYPFFWLDEIVETILNPATHNVTDLPDELLHAIRARLPAEFGEIASRLKMQAFCLYQSEQVKVVAGHYNQAVRLLQQQATANLSQYPGEGLLRQTGEQIVDGLNELAKCLYRRYAAYVQVSAEIPEKLPLLTNLPDKVLCALSADQIGILLKSAFDAKLILGKSFRKVCQAIAPFLSTPWKTDISWDTIRSIAGRAEQRDKEIAIAFLEKMTEKIRGN